VLELATSVVGLMTALATLVMVLQGRRKIGKVGEQVVKVDAKVEQVHELTNSQLTTVLDRVTLLTKTLQDAGIRIPPTALGREHVDLD
jgi:hypothetical protein